MNNEKKQIREWTDKDCITDISAQDLDIALLAIKNAKRYTPRETAEALVNCLKNPMPDNPDNAT